MALRDSLEEFNLRFRKAWGHPFLGIRHFVHRMFWAVRAQCGRLEEGCCFLVTAPMDYVCFKGIHRFLPDIQIVADTRSISRFLTNSGVPHSRRLGFKRCIIQACYLQTSPRAVKKIQINHGLGLAKATYYSKPLKRPMDLYLVSGEMARQRLAKLNAGEVIATGFPKLDPLFDGSIDRKKLLKDMGLPENGPIILYAPTWGPLSSSSRVIPFLPELAKDFTVLVKLHDHATPSLRRWVSKVPNIRLIDDPDSTPYLFLADLLVSDVSSIIFEYSVLNRPIIMIPPDDDWHAKVTNSSWWQVGTRVQDPIHLTENVRELLKTDCAGNQAFRTELIFEAGILLDGQAAARSADAITAFLEREGCHASGHRSGG